jgi:AraC-like DNA-binding protein
MPLYPCLLDLDHSRRERCSHGTPEFPCAGYCTKYMEAHNFEFPWHWHEDMEVLYSACGDMLVQISKKSFTLHTGDIFFINSGILHRILVYSCSEMHSLVFNSRLVSGCGDSAIALKYITPLVHCKNAAGFFPADNSYGPDVNSCFVSAYNSIITGEPGYEFAVRENLSRMCFLLYRCFEKEIKTPGEKDDKDSVRIRKIIAYIQEHYAEPLKLSRIALAAAIGERECLRCFRRVLQISPVQYLIKYRLERGASMLTGNKDISIAVIAMDCGFDSPSNFARLFKRYYGCTPKEYRKRRNVTYVSHS